MKVKHSSFGCTLCLLFAPSVMAQLQVPPIRGQKLHSKVVALTIDDAFPETSPDGRNYAEDVAEMLYRGGYPASFFVVVCHFTGLPTADWRSSMCVGAGSVPASAAGKLAGMDFLPYHHSFSHVRYDVMTPAVLLTDTRLALKFLEPFHPDGEQIYLRCPGLACGKREIDIINSDPELAKRLRGPVSIDVGGVFFLDGHWLGGDWYFYLLGLSPQVTCKAYVDAIRASDHGSIVLMHVRTEVMTGREATRFPLALVGCLVENLSDYTFVPLDAVPGLLGNVRASHPAPWSEEFGADQGTGPVLAGDANGDGKADVFKARAEGVWAMPSDGRKFMPSRLVVPIADPAWAGDFAAKFWLADLDGDGKTDIIYPTAGGVMVSYATAFDPQDLSFATPVFQQLQLLSPDWSPRVFEMIRFGDVNGDGRADLVAWSQAGLAGSQVSGITVALNTGHGFAPATLWSTYFSASGGWGLPQYGSTLMVRDLNGDGLADICVRGSAEVMCGISNGQDRFTGVSGWTRRFNDRQGWGQPEAFRTLSLARIGGKLGLAGGVPNAGIVWQEQDQANGRFTHYRYLDNEHYSTDPAWQPDRWAAGMVFADFDRSGNESPLLVRAHGLAVGLIEMPK